MVIPDGFVILQTRDNQPNYAACMDNGRLHGWLMARNFDGQFVSMRKLEHWEILEIEHWQNSTNLMCNQL